jgi:hypothetical protein
MNKVETNTDKDVITGINSWKDIQSLPQTESNIALRVETIPEGIPFKGFKEGQSIWVRRQIESIGLPLGNLTEVSYEENTFGKENVTGSFNYFDGHLTLYKSLEKLPEIVQLETIVHELAHQNDPTEETGLESYYKSDEAKEHAKKHAEAITEQILETGKYLSGYQKWLVKQYRAGKNNIDYKRLVRENHAILIEQRFTNANHVKQVQEAQKNELIRKHGKQEGLDRYTSMMTEEGQETGGVDKTLIGLIPEVSNKEELNTHISNVRKSFDKEKSPLR